MLGVHSVESQNQGDQSASAGYYNLFTLRAISLELAFSAFQEWAKPIELVVVLQWAIPLAHNAEYVDCVRPHNRLVAGDFLAVNEYRAVSTAPSKPMIVIIAKKRFNRASRFYSTMSDVRDNASTAWFFRFEREISRSSPGWATATRIASLRRCSYSQLYPLDASKQMANGVVTSLRNFDYAPRMPLKRPTLLLVV
jgi:hypothetical protein